MTVDVLQLDNGQQQLLNEAGTQYGLNKNDFMDLISRDLQEAEELRQVKQHLDEKALLSVRFADLLVRNYLLIYILNRKL